MPAKNTQTKPHTYMYYTTTTMLPCTASSGAGHTYIDFYLFFAVQTTVLSTTFLTTPQTTSASTGESHGLCLTPK